MDLLCSFCLVFAMPLYARRFICALWSPAGKGLTCWLSFVEFKFEFVTFPLISWVFVVLDCIDSRSLHLAYFYCVRIGTGFMR